MAFWSRSFSAGTMATKIATVLMGKHVDKAPWDEKEGIRTLPVILGERLARQRA